MPGGCHYYCIQFFVISDALGTCCLIKREAAPRDSLDLLTERRGGDSRRLIRDFHHEPNCERDGVTSVPPIEGWRSSLCLCLLGCSMLGLSTRLSLLGCSYSVVPTTYASESSFSYVNSVLLPPIRGRPVTGDHSGHHRCLSLGRFILVVATLSLGVLLHQFINYLI